MIPTAVAVIAAQSVALCTLSVTGLVSVFRRRRERADVDALLHTAQDIGGVLPSAETSPVRRGPRDLGAVAGTLAVALDVLAEATTRQQAAIEEAVHELRTPMAIIRGHVELCDDDPAERAATTGLVIDEIRRMDRILDDLLLLANPRRPDFLELSDVDVAELTLDAAAKACLLADRQWSVDDVAAAAVRADAQRITQALLQLAVNAVAHTAPGDRIAFGSQVSGGRLRLWVRDGGPGVPQERRATIFERHPNGHGGATGGCGPSGLGLSIVRSIAQAHGGDVVLEDHGPGACFVIELPGNDVLPACRDGFAGHAGHAGQPDPGRAAP